MIFLFTVVMHWSWTCHGGKMIDFDDTGNLEEKKIQWWRWKQGGGAVTWQGDSQWWNLWRAPRMCQTMTPSPGIQNTKLEQCPVF